MSQPPESLTHAISAAALFGVKLKRMLYTDATSQSWLVTGDASGVDEAGGSGLQEASRLHRMVIMSTSVEQNAVLAYAEAQADEMARELGIIDMCIDEQIGAVFIFDYEPALSLASNWNNNSPSVAELCTALIAVLALMVRISRLGYCLGKVDLDTIMIDRFGTVFLRNAGDLHSFSLARKCCAKGVDVRALFALVGTALPDTDLQSVLTALELSLDCDVTESALEVGLHHFSQFVTPAKIRLRNHVDTAESRFASVNVEREEQALPATSRFQRKLNLVLTQPIKLLRL